jgi:hypothetical protein
MLTDKEVHNFADGILFQDSLPNLKNRCQGCVYVKQNGFGINVIIEFDMASREFGFKPFSDSVSRGFGPVHGLW